MKSPVYISGPMTGLPQFNFPAFNTAAAALRSMGYTVVNPAEFGEGEGLAWSDYLRKDIRALMDCATIVLLPGWGASKGARLEEHIARELGMAVLTLDEVPVLEVAA
jgi:Domain of unknown function (DUF4406)